MQKRNFDDLVEALPESFCVWLSNEDYLRGLLDHGYGAPTRHYHDYGHVIDCIMRYNQTENQGTYTSEMYAAIIFHDLVYEVGRGDNELRSAELLSKFADNCFEDADIDFVVSHKIIMATTHKGLPSDASYEEQLMCDIDMMGLLQHSQDVMYDGEEIKKEYLVLYDESQYDLGRIQFFENLLLKSKIYYTLHENAETNVRENIQKELTRIRKKLTPPLITEG